MYLFFSVFGNWRFSSVVNRIYSGKIYWHSHPIKSKSIGSTSNVQIDFDLMGWHIAICLSTVNAVNGRAEASIPKSISKRITCTYLLFSVFGNWRFSSVVNSIYCGKIYCNMSSHQIKINLHTKSSQENNCCLLGFCNYLLFTMVFPRQCKEKMCYRHRRGRTNVYC